MSDESQTPVTSVSDAISGLGDQVDAAVAGNAQQSTPEAQSNPQAAAQDAKATLKDPTASKSEKKAAQKLLNKLTLKVDGEEYEEELPFGIPDDPKAIEYMRRQLQMSKMSHKRAQEKSAIEKDVMKFLSDLQADPIKALSDPLFRDRIDLKKMAASIIEKEIEDSKKSPEQLELEKYKEELKAIKEQQEREKTDREQSDRERLTEKYAEEYDLQLTQALETNRIPKSPAAIKKFADYMEIAVRAGKDVSVNDLIPLIREELASDFNEHLNNLPEDQLEAFIGKPILDKLRKKSVAKAKQAAQNPALKGAGKAPNTGKATEKEEPIVKKTLKELWGV